MPRGDGTGPWWAQGRWNCRRGMGKGQGMGFGRGGRFQQMQGGNELEGLKSYAENLRAELDQVLEQIASLEKKGSEKQL